MEKITIFSICKILIIGLSAGIICGLFSTGGGMILVPAFINWLKMDDVKARGTSVFCILPLVIISSLYYYKGNYINWEISILCGIGGIIGGFVGANLLKKISKKYMRIVFVFFIFIIASKMLFG